MARISEVTPQFAFAFGRSTAKISANNYPAMAVGQNKIPGTDVVRVQAFKEGFTVGAEQLIWAESPTVVWPSNDGEALTAVSNNASDTGVTVGVLGLDENFELKKGFVELDGLTPVALPGLWSRINDAVIVNSKACVGKVSIKNATTTFSAILPANQQDLRAQYSVSGRQTSQVHMLLPVITKVSTGASKGNVIIKVYYRTDKNGVFKMEFPIGLNTEATSTFQFTEPFPLALTGPVDYYITATVTASDTSVGVRMQLLLDTLRENTTL